MRMKGDRAESTEGSSIQPVYAYALVLLSFIACLGIEGFHYMKVWTPLERHYLPAYLRSQIAGVVRDNGWYTLLQVVTRKGTRLALDSNIVPAVSESGENTFALTKEALKQGALRLESQRGYYNNVGMHAYLGNLIYQNQTLMDLVRPALWGGLVLFLVGMLPAIYLDGKHAHELRYGRRLRGPEFVTVAQFNRGHRACGIDFANENRTVLARMLGLNKKLHIRVSKENPHFLIMGDNATGKTQLIIQLLVQIEARNDLAIVHDPDREYTPRFYNATRGDVILHPRDQRMPFWSIGDEVRGPAEASAVAASLFPGRHNQDSFSVETQRKIFAHLLSYRPASQQLTHWMSHAEDIDRLVAGTPWAAKISPRSPGQWNDVLGSLNRMADTFRLLPTEKEAKGRWNTLEWSKKRTGWLFLPSTNITHERLMPITSLWLDLLVMRLFEAADGNEEGRLRPVWFVLNDIALLQKLPKLHDAIARNCQTNNPVVLGVQARSQLQKHYGLDAKTMLSQPATKIFLRTSEPESAKWISDTIGEVEIEQLRESRPWEQWPRSRTSKNYQLERRIEPLVLAAQITGLEDRRGYLKSGNAVVRLSFPCVNVQKVHPVAIERVPEEWPQEPLKITAAAAGKDSMPQPSGARHEPAPSEQNPSQDQELEHAVKPTTRRFFE
jgi:hypothetical protein